MSAWHRIARKAWQGLDPYRRTTATMTRGDVIAEAGLTAQIKAAKPT
jgi:hypothetical protein